MKILSIRQPWAHLITRGRKDIENRTKPTKYRGPFLIHASLTIEKAECRKLGLDPRRSTPAGSSAWLRLSTVS